MSIEHVLYDHNIKNGGSVRSVNGKHGNVTITAAEIGAAPAVHKHEISDVTGLQSSLEVLDTTKELLTDMNRKSVTLAEGTHIVTSETSALVDVEIEGRTLTSLGNSNLEGGKYYVVADPKTKVGVDKKVVGGVGKFQKAQTLNTVADFANKESGSLIGNPHILWYRDGLTSLIIPTDIPNINEHTNNGYQMISRQDGTSLTRIGAVVGGYAQSLFSFNVVEQIERELGLIPNDTLAGKIQWAKDNIGSLIGNWHGYGQGPAGFKASFTVWSTTGVWVTPAASHVNFTGAVAKVARDETANLINRIDSNGYVHFLAYAVPSDGTTSAIINTDFVNLEIKLKPTAQLNTRGKIIRVENFEGKVSGSTVENPHTAYRSSPSFLATPPSFSGLGEYVNQLEYQKLTALDNLPQSSGGNAALVGAIGQQVFSFNVVEAIERNVGKIPVKNNADKVSWVKANLANLTVNWYGFGSNASGNKATLRAWMNTATASWQNYPQTNSSTPAKLSISLGIVPSSVWIDANGFSHYIAYAEPSDGATPSTVYTDYIELEIELKPTADFHAPKVPLYEVTKPEYDKIGIAWDESEVRRRYPAVEGTQHLVNPYVMAEGDNLFPPFTEWSIGVNKINSPYEVTGKGTSVVSIPVQVGAQYIMNVAVDTIAYSPYWAMQFRDIRGNNVGSRGWLPISSSSTTYTLTAPASAATLELTLYGSLTTGDTTFTNPMMTLGSKVKPFTPRNPSYLYAEAKLGSIGDNKDVLFKENGKWKVRKTLSNIENLDTYGIATQVKAPGIAVVIFKDINQYPKVHSLVSPTGIKLIHSDIRVDDYRNANEYRFAATGLFISIKNEETGFADNFTITPGDWKRYFNGWKYSNGTTWTSVTGNGQTATAQVALDTKPTDYTPYKLSYVLAAPVVEEVNVEGEIKVDGITQVEVGSGIILREKANPQISSGYYYLNPMTFAVASQFKYRAEKIIRIFKNGKEDLLWKVESVPNSYGKQRAYIPQSDFDSTAAYTVTYLAEKQSVTIAPTSTKLTYANSIRASFQDLVTDVEDVSTQVSVDSKFLLDLMVQLKAMRG